MIPTLQFGQTGHKSTRVIFGAAAFSAVSQKDADATMELIEQAGINHIDTAASYGESEVRLGPWLEKNRSKVFLATKTGERTYLAAYNQIKLSLERMRVDSVDLIQLHYLVDPAEWEIAMGPGGAIEAVLQAKQEGLVRFIGVTGHDVAVAKMHIKSLEQYRFDSVLLPYNYTMMQNPEYAHDFERLAAICDDRGVAMQTIKGITRSPWDGRTPTTSTWYDPLQDQESIDLAVNWVLGRPGIFLNTASDIHLLPKIIAAANRLGDRPTDAQMDALVKAQSMTPLFV